VSKSQKRSAVSVSRESQLERLLYYWSPAKEICHF